LVFHDDSFGLGAALCCTMQQIIWHSIIMQQNLLHYFLGVYPMFWFESFESMRIDASMQKVAKASFLESFASHP